MYILKATQALYRVVSNTPRLSNVRNIFQTRKLLTENNLNVNTNVAKDVIMFKYDNPRFYRLLNVFALCQFGFWAYLSYFAFHNLRDAPVPKETSEELAWWRKINLGDNTYRNVIAVSAFFIGYGILTISWMYTLKSVRYLILRKGGREVTFVTYTPFGQNRLITVGLDHLSCKETRSASRSQLPIKIKNHYLHYILDMRGEFRNTQLFDHTAGLKRKWKVSGSNI